MSPSDPPVAAPTPPFVMPNRKFRNKPRVIEAEQFWPDRVLPFHPKPYVAFHDGDFYVITAHGQRAVLAPGDWVIPEPSGPHVIAFAAYPVKPDIFDATYERVAAPTPETPSLIEAVEQFIEAAEAYRCASAPIGAEYVVRESTMIDARNKLRAILRAGAVSHPQPEVRTAKQEAEINPRCAQCNCPIAAPGVCDDCSCEEDAAIW